MADVSNGSLQVIFGSNGQILLFVLYLGKTKIMKLYFVKTMFGYGPNYYIVAENMYDVANSNLNIQEITLIPEQVIVLDPAKTPKP